MPRVLSAALLVCLIVCGGSAYGQVQRFGDWKVDLSDPSLYAAVTVNDSNQSFGQICSFDKDSLCGLYFETDTRCTDGADYPVLANAGSQALYLEVHCLGPVKGRYAYASADFEKIEKLIQGSPQVGIAMPSEGNEFSVFRWNLDGVANALSAMRTAVEKRSKSIPRNTPKDRMSCVACLALD